MKLSVTMLNSFLCDKQIIHEEILEFETCTRVTGYIISNKIIHVIKRARLGMEECRRKRCDEASIMSAEVVGLETCTK